MTSFYDRRKASIRGYITRRLKRNETIPLRDVIAFAKPRYPGTQENELVDIVKRVLAGTASARAKRKPRQS
jgi:hypothetical protein